MEKIKNMLIVDDVESNREQLKALFLDEFQIFTAQDGNDAIRQIEKKGYSVDIILLDIIMPDRNGIDVLLWLKSSIYNEIPVIAVTADESYQLKALQSGAWDFISKPAENCVIKARVNNVLGRSGLERENRITETLELYDLIVNESSNAIYVSDINTYSLLHLNETAVKMLGKKESYIGKKCYEYLFDRTSPCDFCRIECMSKEVFQERDFEYPKTGEIYCLRGKLTEWNGTIAHVEYIQKVTENRKIILDNIHLKKQAEDAFKNYKTIVNTVPGAIVLYEIEDSKVMTKFYSDGLCQLSGFSREERDVFNEQDAMALIYDEDVAYVTNEMEKAIKSKSNLNLTYRIKTKSGVPKYVSVRAACIKGDTGNLEYHAVFSDVDELKRMEENAKEQQLRYQVALKSSGINVWEYDIQKDLLMVVSNSPRIKQNCFVIKNYSKTTVEDGYVREDSLADFYHLFEQLKNGVKEVTADLWYKTTDEMGFWCERVVYTSIFDDNGVPIKAFGAGRDVTREKKAEEKIKEETNVREALQYRKLALVKLNLTQNQFISADHSFLYANDIIEACTADEYFEHTKHRIAGEKHEKGF